MHTTKSDGRLSPDAATELYSNAGYDFIALTDHFIYDEGQRVGDLLVIPGCEYDTGDMNGHPIFHIVGVGMTNEVDLQRSSTRHPQVIIDAIIDSGGLAILAHPSWSVTDPWACLNLRGLSGTEIYNTFSGLPWNCRPDSSHYIDLWATKGMLMPCMASDDCHFYTGEETRSYVMVDASDLSLDSIKSALAKGSFYASQGPRFGQINLDETHIKVECSPASAVIFFSNTVYCADRVTAGEAITEAYYDIKPTDGFVRIEIVDEHGKRAWSSPFAVNLPKTS